MESDAFSIMVNDSALNGIQIHQLERTPICSSREYPKLLATEQCEIAETRSGNM